MLGLLNHPTFHTSPSRISFCKLFSEIFLYVQNNQGDREPNTEAGWPILLPFCSLIPSLHALLSASSDGTATSPIPSIQRTFHTPLLGPWMLCQWLLLPPPLHAQRRLQKLLHGWPNDPVREVQLFSQPN
ncbi:hypothetical protein VIGAN_10184200 [Vigna angularis var. angularis]|uniref:Uncharacterized protein n=1 Tax=Vigna angularis var. angularis TaxID=157739 RepID=A0A0S3T4V8_PHAAN|nr:hypothetical protein VIGAN_10184200 [Vigna angularis var. angularis]